VADAQRPPLAPWPGEPESLVVTLDTGEQVHYLDWGGPADGGRPGRPPLLLLHGLGHTAWAWAPVARRLRPLTRVLAMDLRGHGLSEAARQGYDLESQAYDALTVLSANGWGTDVDGQPAAVAGHGLGALIAATAASVRPASIAAVALVDAGWEDLAAASGQSAADFERGLGDPPEVLASMDAYLADRRDYDPASWDADQERAARAAVDEKYAGHVKPVARPLVIHGSVGAMFDYDPDEVAARIEQPLLIAVAGAGTPDDEEGRLRALALDDLLRLRRAAGLDEPIVERFDGAGHNLMRYRPAGLATALAQLLDRAATSARAPGGPA